MTDFADAWESREKKRAAARAAREHRICPIPYPTAPTEGRCCWCDKPLEPGRPKTTRYHRACRSDHDLHTLRGVQFDFVAQRDGLTCGCGCGRSPEKWLWREIIFICHSNPRPGIDAEGHYCEIERVTALELEHREPLWKVRHLPAPDRVWYFGPGNLQLLAPDPCHKIKTSREAAARAHFNTLEEKRLEGPKQKRGPKLQGRGFDKTKTRGFDGKVRERASP